MNAHLEDFNWLTVATGEKLEESCDTPDLLLVSAQVKCGGKMTWEGNNSDSTIDYFLMFRKLCNRLGDIIIDKERRRSAESNHNRITIRFVISESEQQTQEREGKSSLNDTQLQEVSKRIERNQKGNGCMRI